MNILDKVFYNFSDTIFLKSDSTLESDINKLKSIQKSNKSSNLDKDIKLLEYGLSGEKQIAYELKCADIGMYVLHDITIKYQDITAQIDYIIVTKAYIYVVECKNLYGNISIDSKGEFVRTIKINNKVYKEAMYSPYNQAKRHLNIIKKNWLDTHSNLFTSFHSKHFDTLWYKPLVVLSNSNSILDCKKAPYDVKSHIVRVDNLVEYIKNDINNYDRDLYTKQKDMLEIANSFLNSNIVKDSNIVKRYERDTLEDKLRNFRKEKSNKMNIPAYYVFTDKELKDILHYKPKDIDSLRKYLTSIKVNIHGKEIIDIINKENN